jgi:sulfatase modifying factor 1
MAKSKKKQQKPAPPAVPPAVAKSVWKRWTAVVAGGLAVAAVVCLVYFMAHRPSDNTVHANTANIATVPATKAMFGPTIPNTQHPAAPAPKDMVWIPGGEFSMGAQEAPMEGEVGMQATTDSRPIHRVYVDGFYMDKTDVTNAQFAAFVKATGYVTIAEKAPTAEEFPTAPPENLVAGSVVFAPPSGPVPLNDHLQWWSYVKGADWRHPTGPGSSIVGKDNYPVVQVAYPDAEAYAKWAHKRLPTEAEWEFAARGGLAGKIYDWGDEFHPNGKVDGEYPPGTFPRITMPAAMVMSVSHRSRSSRLMDMAFTTWRAMSGSGLRIGIGQTTMRSWLGSGDVARNPQGPGFALYDPAEPGRRRKSTAEDRFFAPTNTARVTW